MFTRWITTLRELTLMQALFWVGFLVVLGIGVPDSGFVLNATMGGNPLSSALAYAFAAIIDVSIFFLAWTTFTMMKNGSRWWQRLPYYIVILCLCLFSAYLLTIYSNNFFQPALLKGAKDVPFFSYLPYIGSIFPAFNLLFAVMSEVIGRNRTPRRELTAAELTTINNERIALAKEKQRIRDEMTKITGDSAENLITTGLNVVSNVLKRRKKNDAPVSSQQAPEEDETESIHQEEDQMGETTTGEQEILIDHLAKDGTIQIGTTTYWPLALAVKHLGVPRKKLERIIANGSLSKRYHRSITMKDGTIAQMVSSTKSAQKRIHQITSNITVLHRTTQPLQQQNTNDEERKESLSGEASMG